MKKTLIALCVLTLTGGVAFAEEATTATAAVAVQEPAKVVNRPDGTTSGAKMRNEMLKEAYKAAGISEESLKKMEELDNKVREARTKGEQIDMQEIRKEREKLITPEQRKKIGDYLREKGMMGRQRPAATDAAKPEAKPEAK